MQEIIFKMGQDRKTGRFVPFEVAETNLDLYEIVSVFTDKRLNDLRDLIYEPEHERGQTCWCEPYTIVKNGTPHIIHNEQRDIITTFVKVNFK